MARQCQKERGDGVTIPDWVFHDLRRTVVSSMAEDLGIRDAVIEKAVNHISGTRAGVAGVYNKAELLWTNACPNFIADSLRRIALVDSIATARVGSAPEVPAMRPAAENEKPAAPKRLSLADLREAGRRPGDCGMISEAERPPLESQLFFQRRSRRIDPGYIVDSPMAVVLANRGHEPSPPLLGQDLQSPQSLSMERLLIRPFRKIAAEVRQVFATGRRGPLPPARAGKLHVRFCAGGAR
jgi:hypothetical protein